MTMRPCIHLASFVEPLSHIYSIHMNTNIKFAWCLGMILYLSACNSKSVNLPVDQVATPETTKTSEQKENEHGGSSPLQLNNGAKWEANAETTQGITNMKKLVSELPATPSEQDYTDLQDKLEVELNLIFQKCTMTGEAHEQLHNFLLPLKSKIEDLDQSTSQPSGQVLDQINTHLKEYDQYFL